MNSFRTIAEQHPESVALVFQKHFISAPVTERNLTNAIKIKGETFCYDLVDAIESEKSNFLGLFESKEKRAARKAERAAKRAAAEKAEKENPAVKKGFTLDKALAIFSTVAGAAGSIIGSRNNNRSDNANNNDTSDMATERILGIDRNLFFVLVALSAVLIFMVIRKTAK